MDQKVSLKKRSVENENFEKYSREELIERVKTLIAHNTQLKNLVAKSAVNRETESNTNTKPFDFSKSNFRHIVIKLFYLGWDYKGYVTQEDTIDTIEYHLFKALTKTKLIKDRPSSNYHRCGRTDKGVSSLGQTISITVRSNLVKEHQDKISEEINYCKILNRVLPDNIQCIGWSPVNELFSARFDCKARTYRYYFPRGKLEIGKMRVACEKFLGTHDFRNFCKMDVGNGVVEFIRNILFISIEPAMSSNDEYAMYVISIKGKAFLWHQIRCIIGILFLIGQNREDPSIIEELFDIQKNPRKPDYNMASEIPLNLFYCEYDDLSWIYDRDALSMVTEKLNNTWTQYSIKECMIRDMLRNINEEVEYSENNKCLSEYLIQGVKSKKYMPVLKRQTCDSLEDKIQHFVKRNRIEVVNKNN